MMDRIGIGFFVNSVWVKTVWFSFFLLFVLYDGFGQVIPPEEPLLAIDTQYSSKTFDDQKRFIIYHFTAGDMLPSLMTLMGNGGREVSSHFLINDTPTSIFPSYVYRLVPEDKRAWHAGVSFWGEMSSINNSSFGVEVVNRNGNFCDYPEGQIEQIVLVGKYLIKKYNIPYYRVLGHSDIAPDRKDDPGILFPWQRLADSGIGIWPKDSLIAKYTQKIVSVPDLSVYQKELRQFGYGIDTLGTYSTQTLNVIRAFQSHFRPQLVNGIMDIECYVILRSLLDELEEQNGD